MCAAECAELAEKQDDPERQREYSDLATMWRLIAQKQRKDGCRLEVATVDSRWAFGLNRRAYA